MKLYEILVTETCVYESTYTVRADSEEEAKRLYYDGESDFEDSEWVETLKDEVVSVSFIREDNETDRN